MRKRRVTASVRSDPVWLHHHLRGRLPTRPAARALQQPRGDPPGRHQDGPAAAAPGATQGQGHRSGAGRGRGGQLADLPETPALSLGGQEGPSPAVAPSPSQGLPGLGVEPRPQEKEGLACLLLPPPRRVEGPELMGSWCKKAGLSAQEAGGEMSSSWGQGLGSLRLALLGRTGSGMKQGDGVLAGQQERDLGGRPQSHDQSRGLPLPCEGVGGPRRQSRTGGS